jgi:hypothetical protein
LRLASACDLNGASPFNASAASSVPAHVRKSFAVNSESVICLRYLLTSAESIT